MNAYSMAVLFSFNSFVFILYVAELTFFHQDHDTKDDFKRYLT